MTSKSLLKVKELPLMLNLAKQQKAAGNNIFDYAQPSI
jgi:hypothetical protein